MTRLYGFDLPEVFDALSALTAAPEFVPPYEGFLAEHVDYAYRSISARWDIEPILPELAHWRGSLLDVGCGTGREAFCLAERLVDLKIVGVDRSYYAIARCRAALSDCSLSSPPEFLWGDVTDPATLSGQLPFEVVVLTNNAIGCFLTPDSLTAFAEAIRRVTGASAACYVLIPGGGFGSWAAETCDAHLALSMSRSPSGQERLVWSCARYEAATRRLGRYYYSQDGGLPGKISIAVERLWTVDEVAPILEAVGGRVGVVGHTVVPGGEARGLETSWIRWHLSSA